MKFTEKNGYKISEFTLGTVQLGIPYGINNVSGHPTYEQSAEILQTAVDNGIISFDTAMEYGSSQEVLGKFFSTCPVEKTLITKVAFSDETPAEIKDSLFAKVKSASKTMGLAKLPLLLLHSETYLEDYGKILTEAMQELKKEGLVSSIGISFSDKSNLMKFTADSVFDSVQIPINMFDNSEIVNGQIKELKNAGITVYARSIFLQGLFFKRSDTLPEKIKSAKPALDKLHKLAEENNMSIAELALSFIRTEDSITSLVLGCETLEQLKNNLSLFKSSVVLPHKVYNRVIELSEEVENIVIQPWNWNK